MNLLRKLIALSIVVLCFAAEGSAAISTSTRSYRAEAWYIISHTFPSSTRSKAFAVAACETVNFTDFWNDGSHAKGLFQEMPGNHNRTFYWKGHSPLTLNWHRISSERPDWYAAQVALYQSYGGT